MKNSHSPAPFKSDEQRWNAVVRRDAQADGQFYYSVKTTGVYCRPSCASRGALRKNVAFHNSVAAAEAAGFRACKRCKPNGPNLAAQHASLVAQACQVIEQAEEPVDLHTLAETVGVSPYYFHRVFKETTGLTPKAYARAHRAKRMREELPRRETVTEAIYSAGYNSNGRFYAESAELLGMKPKAFRGGGQGETLKFAVGQSSLGAILVAASTKGVCAISFGEEPNTLVRELQDQFPHAELVGGDRTFERWVARVVGLVEVPRIGLALPLDIRGTAFQRRVWKALQAIPVGTTASYAEVAERIGSPKSVRAVAQACGANTLAVAIPCHRVVRSDGALSGYRWGVERKRVLQERESKAA